MSLKVKGYNPVGQIVILKGTYVLREKDGLDDKSCDKILEPEYKKGRSVTRMKIKHGNIAILAKDFRINCQGND